MTTSTRLNVLVTGATGKQDARGRQWNNDQARMMEWFDRVGYDADVVGLRSLYPEVNWHRFSVWAREQDWSAIG